MKQSPSSARASRASRASRATLEAVRNFWEAHVNNEYYTKEERGSQHYFDEIERRRYHWHYHLEDLFKELRGSSGRLLEVGCGIGVDSIRLARCGFEVTALDLTESAIQVARRFAEDRAAGIDFRVGNAEDLEFEDETFDAAYAFGVLHHTPQVAQAVAELRRVLKPGGTAYVMLYHRNSLVNFAHWLFRLPYESPQHLKDHCPVVYTFTRQTARAHFRQFSEVRIRPAYPFTYGFRHLTSWIPKFAQRWLGHWFGWHLMVRATR